MSINIIYTIFFGLLNFLLYLILVRSLTLKLSYWIVIGLGIILTLVIHSKLNLDFFMTYKEYSRLLFFSFILVILHFGAKLQVIIITFLGATWQLTNKKIYDFVLKVFDLMRNRLIYFIIYAYQIVAIWNPEVR